MQPGTGFIRNTDCGVESAQVFVSEDYGVRDNKFSILPSTFSNYCWCSVASQRPSNWETATQSFRLYPLRRTLAQNSAPGVINEKRLLFTLTNEYRGISWSLKLDFTLNPLFISIEMNCDGVHHKRSGFHFIQYKKEYCGSDYKSVDEGCSEVMLVSPIKHSPLYTATFWETLLSTVVTMLLSLYISLHGFILESIASRVAPRFWLSST